MNTRLKMIFIEVGSTKSTKWTLPMCWKIENLLIKSNISLLIAHCSRVMCTKIEHCELFSLKIRNSVIFKKFPTFRHVISNVILNDFCLHFCGAFFAFRNQTCLRSCRDQTIWLLQLWCDHRLKLAAFGWIIWTSSTDVKIVLNQEIKGIN